MLLDIPRVTYDDWQPNDAAYTTHAHAIAPDAANAGHIAAGKKARHCVESCMHARPGIVTEIATPRKRELCASDKTGRLMNA